MRTRLSIIRVIAALTVTVSAISSCSKDSQDSLVPTDYASWKSTVDGPLDYEIPGHTQAVRMIYINDIGTTVSPKVENGRLTYRYPEGTIILKENFTNATDEAPNNLTAMIKRPDDPRAHGGWLWVNRDYSSGEEHVFGYEFCFICHQNANERHPYGDRNADGEFRDYVFYPWRAGEGH